MGEGGKKKRGREGFSGEGKKRGIGDEERSKCVGGKFGSWPLTLFNVTTPGPLVIDLSTRLPPFPLPL